MKENERILKPMSLGDIVDYSIEVYKRNFKKTTILALVFYVPFMFIYTLVVSLFSGEFASLAGVTRGTQDTNGSPYMFFAYYAALVGMSFLYFVYSITLKPVMDASIIKIIFNDVVYNTGSDLKETVKGSFKKFSSLLVNKLLYSLMIFGVIIGVYILVIIVFVIILSITFSARPGQVPTTPVDPIYGVIGAIIAGVLLLALILGILLLVAYIAVKFGFGIHAIAIENKSATEGFSRSRELTRKKFWHIALSYFFGAVIFFVIPSIISVSSQITIYFNKNLYILLSTVSQVIGAIIYPFLTVILTMLYINLRIVKEGLDLEVKVDRLIEEQKKKESYIETVEPENI